MRISKKDRKALVISIILFILCLSAIGESQRGSIIFFIPVLIYWGYRFIKNDISFLNIKED